MLGDDPRDAGFDDDDDVAGASVAAGNYTTADFLFYSLAKVTPAASSAIRDTIDAAIRALNKTYVSMCLSCRGNMTLQLTATANSAKQQLRP